MLNKIIIIFNSTHTISQNNKTTRRCTNWLVEWFSELEIELNSWGLFCDYNWFVYELNSRWLDICPWCHWLDLLSVDWRWWRTSLSQDSPLPIWPSIGFLFVNGSQILVGRFVRRTPSGEKTIVGGCVTVSNIGTCLLPDDVVRRKGICALFVQLFTAWTTFYCVRSSYRICKIGRFTGAISHSKRDSSEGERTGLGILTVIANLKAQFSLWVIPSGRYLRMGIYWQMWS